MELFAICCTTCQARLKVRDTAAIGKILACPKCGSMVQVAAPAGWRPPAPEAINKIAAEPSTGSTIVDKRFIEGLGKKPAGPNAVGNAVASAKWTSSERSIAGAGKSRRGSAPRDRCESGNGKSAQRKSGACAREPGCFTRADGHACCISGHASRAEYSFRRGGYYFANSGAGRCTECAARAAGNAERAEFCRAPAGGDFRTSVGAAHVASCRDGARAFGMDHLSTGWKRDRADCGDSANAASACGRESRDRTCGRATRSRQGSGRRCRCQLRLSCRGIG